MLRNNRISGKHSEKSKDKYDFHQCRTLYRMELNQSISKHTGNSFRPTLTQSHLKLASHHALQQEIRST